MGPGWKKMYKVVCKKCDKEWGIKAKWEDRLNLPVIKIDGFKVKDPADNRVAIYKRWKNCPIAPVEISLNETLIAMSQDMESMDTYEAVS